MQKKRKVKLPVAREVTSTLSRQVAEPPSFLSEFRSVAFFVKCGLCFGDTLACGPGSSDTMALTLDQSGPDGKECLAAL